MANKHEELIPAEQRMIDDAVHKITQAVLRDTATNLVKLLGPAIKDGSINNKTFHIGGFLKGAISLNHVDGSLEFFIPKTQPKSE